MEFIDEKLDRYVCDHSESEPELLAELNRDTHLHVMKPRMLSGHFQGRVLSMFSHMIQPSSILEIGTYTGYSALCLSEGLKEGGKLVTLDRNEELEDMVREYFGRSARSDVFDYRIGNAMEIIPQLEINFDLVFIDADKSNYIHYYDMVIDKINSGGYILIDNVLWSGKVIEPLKNGDIDTQVLMELNKKVHEDSRVQEVLFPIRDGLLVIRKK